MLILLPLESILYLRQKALKCQKMYDKMRILLRILFQNALSNGYRLAVCKAWTSVNLEQRALK